MKLIALVLSLTLFIALAIQVRADDAKVPAIPVTRTWGDLVKTPPLALKDLPPGAVADPKSPETKSLNPRVWLGIDRDKVPSYSEVTIYCLAQDIDFGHAMGQFGPFDVQVHQPSIVQPLDAALHGIMDSSLDGTVYHLYSYRVAVQEPGTYVVELSEPVRNGVPAKPRVYARVKVNVTTQTSPWTPWEDSPKAKALKQDSDDPSTIVCNPAVGFAVPILNNEVEDGRGLPFNKLPSPDLPLPRLLPDQPDPATRLKMEGDTLIVTLRPVADDESASCFTSWKYQFLTRWWVNDKPFTPAHDENMDEHAAQDRTFTADKQPQEIRFQLDFKPGRLGAKKGDKIGVQLLYCPEGWDVNEDGYGNARAGEGAEMARDPNQIPPDVTFLSNRVDFVYSGDPETPQQK